MPPSPPPGPRRHPLHVARIAGLVLALAACLPASPATARKKPMPLDWEPALTALRKPDPRLQQHGERVVFRQNGVVVQVELLDAPRRALFFGSAGLEADPFATATLGTRAWTFLVRVENTAEVPLTFRPPAVSMYTKKPLSVSSPCDFLCLQDAASKAGLGDDGIKTLLAVSVDTSEVLGPGDRMSKIMAFVHVPERFKMFMLEMDGFVIDDRALSYAVPYRPREDTDEEARTSGREPAAATARDGTPR